MEERTKTLIKQVLGSKYNDLDGAIIDDFVALSTHLTKETIIKHLTNLDRDLKKALVAKQKTARVNSDSKFFTGEGVLFTLLAKWAQENGFNQGGKVFVKKESNSNNTRELIDLPKTIPDIGNILTPRVFTNLLLRYGYFAKDPGAGALHSDFTHTLQFYVLIEENKINKFLNHSFIELYKFMGSEKCVNFGKGTDSYISVFEILFDRFYAFDKLIDGNGNPFRNPDFFNVWIAECVDEHHLTTLSQFMKKRIAKRSTTSNFAKQLSNTPGIKLNDVIVFVDNNSESQESLIFDNVGNNCIYDPTLKDKFELPFVNRLLPILEQIKKLFDPNNVSKDHLESKDVAKEIQHDLEKFNSHYLLALRLEQYSNKDLKLKSSESEENRRKYLSNPISTNDPYILFLINESKKLLIEYDEKDLAQPFTTTFKP